MKNLYCIICGKYRKFERPKISYFLEFSLSFAVSVRMKKKKYLKKNNQLKY